MADRADRLGLQGEGSLREGAGAGAGQLEVDRLLEVRPLAGPEDIGMAGEDLLDQGAARAGHADDQDGGGPRIPCRPHARLEALAEQVRQTLELLQRGHLVVAEGRPLQPVRLGELLEGPIDIAGVAKRLRQGEAQLDAALGGKAGGAGRELLHLGQDRVALGETAQGGEVLVEARRAGLQLDGLLERGDRLLPATQLGKQVAPVAVRLGELRRPLDGAVVAGEGLFGPHQLLQLLAAIVEGERIVGVQGQQGLEGGQGLVMTPKPREHDAAVVETGDMAGFERKHRVVAAQRLGPAALIHGGDRPGEGRRRVVHLRLRLHHVNILRRRRRLTA